LLFSTLIIDSCRKEEKPESSTNEFSGAKVWYQSTYPQNPSVLTKTNSLIGDDHTISNWIKPDWEQILPQIRIEFSKIAMMVK